MKRVSLTIRVDHTDIRESSELFSLAKKLGHPLSTVVSAVGRGLKHYLQSDVTVSTGYTKCYLRKGDAVEVLDLPTEAVELIREQIAEVTRPKILRWLFNPIIQPITFPARIRIDFVLKEYHGP